MAVIRDPEPFEEMRVRQDETHVLIQHMVGCMQLLEYPMAIDFLQELLRAAYAVDSRVAQYMGRAHDGLIRVREHEKHVFLFLDIVRHAVAFAFSLNTPICVLTPMLAVDLAAGINTMIAHGQDVQVADLSIRSQQSGNETRH